MNKKMKYLLILLACLGLMAMNRFMPTGMSDEMSEESKMLYKFGAQIGKEIGKKYKMFYCGVGGGTDKGIWLISATFQRYDSFFTEEKGRKLIINCLDDYLEMVNKNETLRPFLKVYPFKPENIDIDILNYTSDNKDIFDPYLFAVTASRGEIGFFTHAPEDSFKFKSEKYETYEEAISILQNK